MTKDFRIIPLSHDRLEETIQLVLDAELDAREEIGHHLIHMDAHYIALNKNKVIGVIGWYQDTVNYANAAMGVKFPGEEAYWVGFFAVSPKHRGIGVGYSLLSRLKKELNKKNSKKLWVSSVPETEAYYSRQGFQNVMRGEIGGNPKVFMVKEIKGS